MTLFVYFNNTRDPHLPISQPKNKTITHNLHLPMNSSVSHPPKSPHPQQRLPKPQLCAWHSLCVYVQWYTYSSVVLDSEFYTKGITWYVIIWDSAFSYLYWNLSMLNTQLQFTYLPCHIIYHRMDILQFIYTFSHQWSFAHLHCAQVFAIVDSDTVNILVQWTLGGTAELWTFNFIYWCHIVFQTNCANLQYVPNSKVYEILLLYIFLTFYLARLLNLC